MTRFFLSLYRYFKKHKTAMYAILAATTIFFGFFASKIRFQENIFDLLPKTDKSQESSVAFGDIKLKDKLFLQVASADDTVSASTIAASMDEFMDILNAADSGKYILNSFYRIDDDDLMNILDYALTALPCHLGDDFYNGADTLLTEEFFEKAASGLMPPCLPDLGGYALVDRHMFCSDSTVAIAFLTPNFSDTETLKAIEFEDELDRAVKEYKARNNDVKVLYHGTVIEGCFNSRQIKKDLAWTVCISLLIICLLLCICLKSRGTILQIIAPLVYGVLAGLAGVYLVQGEMSLIAIGIGALIIGVAMSYCLHIIVHKKFVKDPEDILKEQAKPVCLGCLTTIGAFAGLLLTSSKLLWDFGLFASIMLVGTTLFALIFLPHLLTDDDSRKNEKAFNIINKINSCPLDRNKAVVALMVIICIICFFTSKNVKFDSDLNNIGYLEPKMLESEDLFNSKFCGNSTSVFFAAHSSVSLDEAIILSRQTRGVLDSLKEAGTITSYNNIDAILLPLDEQRKNIEKWKNYWTPARVQRTHDLLQKEADRYGWFETTGFDIPETFTLMAEADYEPVSLYEYGAIPEGLLNNFVERNEDGYLVYTNVMMPKDNVKAVTDRLTSEKGIIVLDPFYYTGDMVEIIHEDFNKVLLISSIFVFIVLLLSFRNLLLAIIAFLPMFLSWYVVQGVMAIFGLEFNLVNIMISTFVFGIGVDYSIFVMEGLISKNRYSSYRLLVCNKAAIFFSGIALLIVTASLLFATHPAIYSIGISTIIGMTSTILITYALQPMLFRIIMKRRNK